MNQGPGASTGWPESPLRNSGTMKHSPADHRMKSLRLRRKTPFDRWLGAFPILRSPFGIQVPSTALARKFSAVGLGMSTAPLNWPQSIGLPSAPGPLHEPIGMSASGIRVRLSNSRISTREAADRERGSGHVSGELRAILKWHQSFAEGCSGSEDIYGAHAVNS